MVALIEYLLLYWRWG